MRTLATVSLIALLVCSVFLFGFGVSAVSGIAPNVGAAEAKSAEGKVVEGLRKLGIRVEPGGQVLPEKPGIYLSLRETHITLRTDQLSKDAIEAIGQLSDLHTIFMVGPDVTDATLERVKGLQRIRNLGLLETKVTDAGLEHVKAFTHLRGLLLDKSAFSDEGLENLSGLKHLRKLSLFGTSIGDSGLANLKQLTGLGTLELRYTKVTDKGLESLQALPCLRELDLSGTAVTDAGMRQIVAMARLERLDLSETKVTDAGVREVRKALPKCKVAFGCRGKDMVKQAEHNAKRIVGRWKSPPRGWQNGELGPTQNVIEFDSTGKIKAHLIVSAESPGGGGVISDEGTYRITGNTLTTDVLVRGEPVKFEFKDDHLILTFPREAPDRPIDVSDFVRVREEKDAERSSTNEKDVRKPSP